VRLPFDLIVFDLETAGAPDHRVIEIGAVRLDRDLNVSGRWGSLIDGRPVDEETQAIHGISNEMLAGKPKFAEIHTEFDEWCQRSETYVMSAFGAYFDIPVLREEYKRISRKYPHPGHAVDIKAIVWWDLLKKGMPCKYLNVERTLELLGLKFEGTRHRGPDDAWNEARILMAMSKKQEVTKQPKGEA